MDCLITRFGVSKCNVSQNISYKPLHRPLSYVQAFAVQRRGVRRSIHGELCNVIVIRVSAHPVGAHPLKHPVHLLSK